MRKTKVFLPGAPAPNLPPRNNHRNRVDDLVAPATELAIKLGWRILPVAGKRPTTPRGVYDATNNPTEIAGWINLASDRATGIAVACGDGFDVVDIDTHRPPEWIERAVSAYEGPIALTPHGIHLFVFPFARKSAVRPLPYIDIRTYGSYVVLPPSTASDGKKYAWIASPLDVKPRPCPYVLRKKLLIAEAGSNELTIPPPAEVDGVDNPRLRQYVTTALTKMAQDIAGAQVGTRNQTLYIRSVKAGGYVAAGLISIDEVASTLAAAGFRSGLATKETAATIKSGLKAGMSRPWVPVVRAQKQ